MRVPSMAVRPRGLVLLLAVVLVGIVAAPVAAGSHEERRLTEQAARLAEVREQIDAVRDDVALGGQELAEVQAQLTTVIDAVRAAEESVLRSQEAVADAAARVAVAVGEQEEQRRVAAGRAAQRCMRGGDVALQAVLVADSAAEVLD